MNLILERTCSRCASMMNAQNVYLCRECRSRLSPRERQITALVSRGFSNKLVAYELRLRLSTVKEYNHTIFRKVGVTNRTELTLWWLDQHQQLVA